MRRERDVPGVGSTLRSARMNDRPPAIGAVEPERPLTYQDLLDESLQETFPASDPITPNGACHTGQRISTSRNDVDWQVVPGSAQRR